MSSFAAQGGQLRGSLIAAGLPAAAATIISNILANSVQTLRHNGEIVHDQTPSGLRQVTPDARTHRLTNLDFRDGDPDYRRQRSSDSEGRQRSTQQDTVTTSVAPQQTVSSFRIKGGDYTSVDPAGDTAVVNLRVAGAGDCMFRDPANNLLVGKDLRAESDASDLSRLRFFIERRPDEVVFKLSTSNVSTVDVITGVDLTANALVFHRKTVYAWAGSDLPDIVIPIGPCPET
jgi:hypothetical protein